MNLLWNRLQEQRHAAVQEASRREVNRYAAKQEGIECAIATAEDDIKQAKATLLEAQVLRSNLVAYEVIPLYCYTISSQHLAQHWSSLGDLGLQQI